MSTVCRLWGENPEKIALLTDSCADLRPEYRDGKPIFMVPLKILCRDGEYADGVDISAADIYARLGAGELPKTSLPDGGSVEAVLDAIAALPTHGPDTWNKPVEMPVMEQVLIED